MSPVREGFVGAPLRSKGFSSEAGQLFRRPVLRYSSPLPGDAEVDVFDLITGDAAFGPG